MTVFEAIVLGVIQGLAEFLPVSSSAHLLLTRWLFGWEEGGLAFDVALHFGTLIAVLWYFRAEWIRLAVATKQIVVRRRIETVAERRAVFLVIATIPAAVAGLLLEELAETEFREPAITATTLIVLGLLLWGVDRFVGRWRRLDDLRWTDALLIGIAQVAALVPGVSRSGATITAGRALGMERESAAVFSFLMSMPVIAAAAVVKVPEAIAEMGFSPPLVAGVLAATLSSWAAIAILLRYVARHSFGIFAVYRVALGIAVFALLAGRG
ncbi:MAG TPA: undecaprenyl-diphosphate phosphatase [Gemmatimonadaceae bacterium]|nr:undecaprenyl-diphosphate phosphatase [Gemmatimonadaceae bacterium]